MKKISLFIYGPLVLIFLVIAAALFVKGPKSYLWYRSQIKKWSRHVLWALDIALIISPESKHILGSSCNSVLVANHRSHLDSVILWAICPEDKHLVFAAKKELFRIPFLGAGLKLAKAISVDRSRGKLALRTLIDETRKLSSNEALVIYPEGTRGVGRLLDFKRGAFTIALESHRDILPVCIKGTDIIFPKGKQVPLSGEVLVRVCDVIPYEHIEGTSDIELAKTVRELMHTTSFFEEELV